MLAEFWKIQIRSPGLLKLPRVTLQSDLGENMSAVLSLRWLPQTEAGGEGWTLIGPNLDARSLRFSFLGLAEATKIAERCSVFDTIRYSTCSWNKLGGNYLSFFDLCIKSRNFKKRSFDERKRDNCSKMRENDQPRSGAKRATVPLLLNGWQLPKRTKPLLISVFFGRTITMRNTHFGVFEGSVFGADSKSGLHFPLSAPVFLKTRVFL